MNPRRIFRGCLSALCFIIFGFGAVVIGTLILPSIFILVRSKERGRRISIRVIRNSWRLFLFIMRAVGLIEIHLKSYLKIPLREIKGCVIVSNHPSLIDIIIITTLFPDPICIVKNSLKDNLFMKHIIRRLYITNDLVIDNMLDSSTEALKLGYNLIIFPEGTRSIPNKKPTYQRGAVHIALAAAADIITMNISLTDNILGKHQRFYEVSDRRVIYTVTIKNRLKSNAYKNSAAPAGNNVREVMRLIKKDIE